VRCRPSAALNRQSPIGNSLKAHVKELARKPCSIKAPLRLKSQRFICVVSPVKRRKNRFLDIGGGEKGNLCSPHRKKTFSSSVQETSHHHLTDAEFAPHAGSDLQGFWVGMIGRGKSAIHIQIKIAEASDGIFRGDFYCPDQHADRQPTAVSYDGTIVKLMTMAGYGLFEGGCATAAAKRPAIGFKAAGRRQRP
jgi:hypothetical protein